MFKILLSWFTIRGAGHWKSLSDHLPPSTQPTLSSRWSGLPRPLGSTITHTKPSRCCYQFYFIFLFYFIIVLYLILFYHHTHSHILKWPEPDKGSPHSLSGFIHSSPRFSIPDVYPGPLDWKGISTLNSWKPYLWIALPYRMVRSVLYYDMRVKASWWTCPLDLPKLPESRWTEPSLVLKAWNSLLPTKQTVL